MKRILPYWLGLLLCLMGMTATAQQPIEEWSRRYDSQGPTSETPGNKMVAVDEAGNSYVTGASFNSNTGVGKIITIKYSPTGEELWVVEYEKEGIFPSVSGLAVDNDNGVYVTGSYVTIRYDASSGNLSWEIFNHIYNPSIVVDNRNGLYISGSVYNNDTGWDYTIIRYDAASGEKDWESSYNGENNNSEFASAIAVDNDGGVYVTGTSYGETAAGSAYVTVRYDVATGTKTWDNSYSQGSFFWQPLLDVDNMGGVFITGTTYSDITGYDITTIRYDAANGEQKWTSSYNGEGNGSDGVRDIAVDNQGNVFVTGVSGDSYIESKYITISYDGATGEQLWATPYSEEGNTAHWATAIAVDATGVYVTGSSRTGSNSNQFTTIHYDAASGMQLWIRHYKGKEKAQHEATGIALDNKGGVIVAGYDFTKRTGKDLVTIRYEAATGDRDWIQRYNSFGSQSDAGIAVAVDAVGNSYVTGTSSNYNFSIDRDSIVTIKYSPTGEELWVKVYGKGLSNRVRAIAIDNDGGIYVTGTSRGTTGSEFVTIRYDAATGDLVWDVHFKGEHSSWNEAVDIAVDNEGSVYVTGSIHSATNGNDFATIRYDAATGKQKWSATYSGAGDSHDTPAAIAADNTGGIYVTGISNSDYLTLRYDAATGEQKWATPYNGEADDYDAAVDIAIGQQGSVYVTGISRGISTFFDYVSVRYDAATGEQKWASRYDAGRNGYDYVEAIAVDEHGVYVTGSSQSIGGEEVEYAYDFVTVGYEAGSGNQKWVSRYDGEYNDLVSAIAVDNAGGVYVTGHSETRAGAAYSTLRYNVADGAQVWAKQTEEGGLDDSAMDLALDPEGNVIVTGYSFHPGTGNDILTVKYGQQAECPALADAVVKGKTTAAAGSLGYTYSITAPGATSFSWSITDGQGASYTDFTGQGSGSITVRWPSSPNVYKVSATYSAREGCPSETAVTYVHVFDPQAGFVTGGGWINSPTNIDYEFMQKGTRAYFGIMAKYKKGEGDPLHGETHLLLENGSFYFRGVTHAARTLVISGNQAFYRGFGTVTYLGANGSIVNDQRRFGFLVAVTDGGLGKAKDPDRLRLLVWEIKADGSRGAVVYDNQSACGSGNLDENVAACYTIGGGNIVIHTPNVKSARKDGLLAAESIPAGLEAYPTAFNERTTLAFTTEWDTEYTLELYDLKGALVKEILVGTAEAGKRYEQELRADSLPRGLYLARLTTGTTVQTVKLIVHK